MIAGIILIVGGIAQLVTGMAVPADSLIIVGGLWAAAGLVNTAWSRVERRSAALMPAPAPATGASARHPGTAASAQPPRKAADREALLTDPIALANTRRSLRGAPWRGVITLLCAAAAITVGVVGRHDASSLPAPPSGTEFAQWSLLPLILGGILGVLSLLGLLMVGATGAERAATLPATVTVDSFAESAFNNTGGRPTVRFTLTVNAQGFSAYQVQTMAVVPMLAASHLEVGAQYKALAAGPSKPKALIVDWNKRLDDASATSAGASKDPASGADDAGTADLGTRLKELDDLLARQVITPDEHQAQRARILGEI